MLSSGHFFLFFCCVILLSCRGQVPPEYNQNLQQSTQLIIVTAKGSASNGELQFYERETPQDKWQKKFAFPVMLGRNGLAADNNYYTDAAISKKEGDGCSPAGVFTLGPVFSYHEMENLKMPFQQVTKQHLCVDDVQSAYYNQLIYTDTIAQADWKSFEYMQRNDLQYEYGIWVNYNTDNIIPGNGSCIFLHVWSGENAPTSGCTAMRKENLLQLIQLLDEKRNPMLIQFAE